MNENSIAFVARQWNEGKIAQWEPQAGPTHSVSILYVFAPCNWHSIFASHTYTQTQANPMQLQRIWRMIAEFLRWICFFRSATEPCLARWLQSLWSNIASSVYPNASPKKLSKYRRIWFYQFGIFFPHHQLMLIMERRQLKTFFLFANSFKMHSINTIIFCVICVCRSGSWHGYCIRKVESRSMPWKFLCFLSILNSATFLVSVAVRPMFSQNFVRNTEADRKF